METNSKFTMLFIGNGSRINDYNQLVFSLIEQLEHIFLFPSASSIGICNFSDGEKELQSKYYDIIFLSLTKSQHHIRKELQYALKHAAGYKVLIPEPNIEVKATDIEDLKSLSIFNEIHIDNDQHGDMKNILEMLNFAFTRTSFT